MKIFRFLLFFVVVVAGSRLVFIFFQNYPNYFPIPDVSPAMWAYLEKCCAILTYEDKSDLEFLTVVGVSLLISSIFTCFFFVLFAKNNGFKL